MHRLLIALAALLVGPTALAAPDMGYDLAANAPLAHVYRDGVVADAASPGFVKYLRDMNGSWILGQTEDGRPAAIAPGLQANLWLPVGPEAKGDMVLDTAFKALGSKKVVDVFVNGKKVKNIVLEAGWGTHRIALPAGALKPGLVKVRLHFARTGQYQGKKVAAAVRYVRLAPASAAALPADEAALAAALKVTDGGALALPAGAGLDYYVTPVKGMKVVGSAAGGEAEVWTQLDGQTPKRLGGGATLSVSLDRVAGKAVRLMLRGKGAVKLSGARLDAGTAGRTTIAKPKYVVFWLIDTLRADKLGFYEVPNSNARPKVKTPNLDAVAREATVFEPYWVQGSESKASHASLFTGTYPAVHGVFSHKAKLRSSHTTLAEAFAKAGYKTGGFVANGYVSDRWNYAQGFKAKDFTNTIRENKANSAQALVRGAKKWIDANKDKPFYLYMGTSDPHVTYRRHKEFIDQYDTGGPYKGRYQKSLSGTELGKLKTRKKPPSARDRARIEALYENEIAFNDKWFGKLVEHLKEAGIYDETMIIITSDHGDEFWEHGSCGHGHSLHQGLVNVPFVVRWPKMFPAGRATFGSSGVDVLPTLQAMLGQKRPGDVQGDDLLPFVNAEGAVYPRAIIASQGTGSYALQAGPAKVIMRSERSIRAYDVAKDPTEKTDVFGQKMVTSLAALDPLSIFLTRAKTWDKADMGSPNNLSKGFK